MPPHLLTNFEYKVIIKTTLNLTVFFSEMIYLKNWEGLM